jgi:hypothetical protein
MANDLLEELAPGPIVEGAIYACLTEWESALEWAIDHLPDPPEPSGRLEWAIALVGNLLWAFTVFFPVEFVLGKVAISRVPSVSKSIKSVELLAYPTASVAIKIASVTGAVIGSSSSQIAGLIRNTDGNLRSKEGKAWMHDFILGPVSGDASAPSRMDQFSSFYMNEITEKWLRENLLVHLMQELKSEKPEDLIKFVKVNPEGARTIRRHIWNTVVFTRPETSFDKWRGGLESYYGKQLEALADSFGSQWKTYKNRLSSGGAIDPGSYGRQPPISFRPVIKFPGIPQDVQSLFQTDQAKIGLLTNGPAT